MEDNAENNWHIVRRYPGIPHNAEEVHPLERGCDFGPVLLRLLPDYPVPAQRFQIFYISHSTDSLHAHHLSVS